jgi:hypothetical protein
MTDNIIAFPGFILLEDRNTIMKAGKRYKNTKAMVNALSMQERKETLHWYERWHKRRYGHANYRLDYRMRLLHYSVYEPDSSWVREGGSAA